jgi:glycosyltransferase involved in cell wall biosynthesis
MNLTLVTDHHLNSGIGRYSFELSRALREQQEEVQLFKPYKQNADDSHFDQKFNWIRKIRYRSLRNLHPYLLPFFIGGHLGKERSQVFHGHWFMAGLGLQKARKRNMVVTMHDVSLLHETETNPGFARYYRHALQLLKKAEVPVIVVSEQAKQDAIRYAGFSETQVHAIPNGINFDQFRPLSRTENETFKIVYAGGLGPRKNLGLLLEACEVLEKRQVRFQLDIAGNHPERTPYPSIACSRGLKQVRFVGFLPDDQMNAFYNSADLMVYTSKYEGFGFAPLEAMAAGTPVISTKGGSLDEIAGGGCAQVRYSKYDLADTIQEFMKNPALREQFRKKGLDWVKQYTWASCAEKTLKVYQNVA